MHTVEEALRLQDRTSRFLLEYCQQLGKEDGLFSGPDDVAQFGFLAQKASLYVWARPIKHLIDGACGDYPLDEAIDATHHFHQPHMFWLFDEPVLWIQHPTDGTQEPIDAILITPFAQGEPRTPQEIADLTQRFDAASPEVRAQMLREIQAQVTGVGILAMRIHPAHRCGVPLLRVQFLFGRPVNEYQGTIPEDERRRADPTIFEELPRLQQWVLAGSALLRQRILVAARQTATRPERKRLAADGLDDSVLTITLRASQRSAATSSEHHAIAWAHQWITRSHWRNQWYPSHHEHRVILIPSHLKGPTDRPLRVHETVFKATR